MLETPENRHKIITSGSDSVVVHSKAWNSSRLDWGGGGGEGNLTLFLKNVANSSAGSYMQQSFTVCYFIQKQKILMDNTYQRKDK